MLIVGTDLVYLGVHFRRKGGILRLYGLLLATVASTSCIHTDNTQTQGEKNEDSNGSATEQQSKDVTDPSSTPAPRPPSRTQRPARLEDKQNSSETLNRQIPKSTDQENLKPESLVEEIQDTTELVRNQQGDTPDDIATARRIKRHLWENAESFETPIADITVTANSNVVTLGGTVETEEAAKAIVESVTEIANDAKVRSNLHVK